MRWAVIVHVKLPMSGVRPRACALPVLSSAGGLPVARKLLASEAQNEGRAVQSRFRPSRHFRRAMGADFWTLPYVGRKASFRAFGTQRRPAGRATNARPVVHTVPLRSAGGDKTYWICLYNWSPFFWALAVSGVGLAAIYYLLTHHPKSHLRHTNH